MSLRIAHVTSEFAGLAQTGGLADAVAALSKELGLAGHDVRVFLPFYERLEETEIADSIEPGLQEIVIPFANEEFTFSVSSLRRAETAVTIHLIGCPRAYRRSALYDTAGDEHLRFALLARAAIESCQGLGWSPHIFHCHDWHSALLPLYLRTLYAWDEVVSEARTVLTIHNLAYQGAFSSAEAADLELVRTTAESPAVVGESEGVNFLATGIRHADWITTVSPGYAREILTPEYGVGLDQLLRTRRERLQGILNGVDYGVWDPARDPVIPRNYSASDLDGKAVCRRDLLAELGLDPEPAGPVLGIVSRLAEQKGMDLVLEVAPEILATRDVRLVVLGSGDESLERSFAEMAGDHRGKMVFVGRFDSPLAHRIEAGSDAFLMPSRFEPCGLNQMYSLRYATPPVVHKVGGLADTVEEFDPRSGTGTGFLFEPFIAAEFRESLEGVVAAFERPELWRKLMLNGMAADFSWPRQVELYEDVYERALGEGPSRGDGGHRRH